MGACCILFISMVIFSFPDCRSTTSCCWFVGMVRERDISEYVATDQHHPGPCPSFHCCWPEHVYTKLLWLCGRSTGEHMSSVICEYSIYAIWYFITF